MCRSPAETTAYWLWIIRRHRKEDGWPSHWLAPLETSLHAGSRGQPLAASRAAAMRLVIIRLARKLLHVLDVLDLVVLADDEDGPLQEPKLLIRTP